MEALDDRAREPDARAFGTLVHDTLEAMADAGKAVWGCGDAARLGDWLERHLRENCRRLYMVPAQLGSSWPSIAPCRLRAFARQVEWHAAGWGDREE